MAVCRCAHGSCSGPCPELWTMANPVGVPDCSRMDERIHKVCSFKASASGACDFMKSMPVLSSSSSEAHCPSCHSPSQPTVLVLITSLRFVAELSEEENEERREAWVHGGGTMSIYRYTYMHACMHTYIHTYIYMCVCIYIYILLFICVYLPIRSYIYIYIYR